MNCRSCDHAITPFFSLGDMPLVNSFLSEGDIENEKKYDLTVCFCPECFLVQLLNIVPPEELFSHYLYFSSTSASFLTHCKLTADSLAERFSLSKASLVMEIASNDGAQLQYFQQLGIPVLGVDPAKNIAEIANANGIPTLPEFFTNDFARTYLAEGKQKPDLIFGANVLAHVPEINDFLAGVKQILATNGTAVFEFPYLKGLLDNKFDTIYHEHVFYYSLSALVNVFKHAGLEIYDVEQTQTQGGSLRIFAAAPSLFEHTTAYTELLAEEKAAGFTKIETYQHMNERVAALKQDIIDFLNRVKAEGKSVAAYSAPAKGNILLNFFGIGTEYLDFIVDKAESKQGLYTPGTHLKVYPPEKVLEDQPDYLVVLCWNIADEVMDQLHEYKERGGTFVIPIPTLKIV